MHKLYKTISEIFKPTQTTPLVPVRNISRTSPKLLALEQRFMFDGAAVADAAHAVTDAAPDATAQALSPQVVAPADVRSVDPTQNNGKKEVVFVDTSVRDYQQLISSMHAGVEIVEINRGESGLAQIAAWAQTRSGYDAIHIISHGSNASITLGGEVINTNNLSTASVQAELATIGQALNADGDVLLYGCDIASGVEGQVFVSSIAKLTGADIGASTDKTGAEALGGNWVLESQTGTIDVPILTLPSYATLLAQVNFDFENMSSDSNFRTQVSQTVGSNTLVIDTIDTTPGTPGDGGIKVGTQSELYSGPFGGPGFSGVNLSSSSGEFLTSVTLSVQGGKLFDLDSFAVAYETGETGFVNFLLTTNTGQTSTFSLDGRVPANGDPKTIDLSANTGFDNITSVTITATNNGGQFVIGLDNIRLSNIQSPTPAPTTVVSTATLSADTGSSSTDFITKTAAQTISGTLSANLAAGESVQVSYDNGSTWGNATSSTGSNTWSATTTLAGSNTFQARVSNAGGSSTALTRTYTLDTTAPAATSAPDMTTGSDSGSSSTDNITNDNTPTITGTAEANSTITLFDTDGTTVIGTGSANGAGNWSITTSTLSAGNHTLTARATDVAGNVSAASSGLTVTIDTTAPTAPSAPDMTTGSDSGSSSTDNITNDNTPTITGTAEANSTITLFDTDGTTVIGTGSANGAGNWSITTSTLSAGNHTLTARATDVAGNVSVASSGLTVTIDTTAPTAPSAPDMTTGSDSGSSSTDNITNDNTPTITGTAEANSTITLFDTDGTTVIGTGSADGAGNWSITTSTLSAGNHTLTARATDVAGNVSVASSGLTVTIDTTAPTAPSAPDMTTGSDSGSSSTDNITNDNTPTITGTAEANSTITLFDTDGTTVIGTGSANGAGNWSITTSTLSAGNHTLTATATDVAGNVSAASSGLTVTIDTTAPTTPTVNALSTSNTTPTLTGTASSTAGETLTITVGGASYNVVPASGQWSLDLSSATPASGSLSLVAGSSYSVTAVSSDVAGNTSTDSSSNELTITLGPVPTVVVGTASLSADTGSSSTDFITQTASQTISGTLSANLQAGETVEVSYDNGSTWSNATSFSTGSNTWSTTATLAGSNTLQVRVTNANGSSAAFTQTYSLDTTAPTTTIATAAFSADTGSSSSDFITRTAAQTVSGTLSANLATGETVFVSLNNGSTWTAATATVGSNTWSLSGQTLTASNTLRVKVTDTAGNDGSIASQAYTLDTTAPTVTFSGLALSADSGSGSTDFITNTAAQTITATLSAAPAGTDIVYGSLDNGSTWTDITNKVSGTTLTWNGVTLSGSNTLRLKVTDSAGNDGSIASQAYTLDTSAPTAPSSPDLISSNDNGSSNTDNITNVSTPIITGTAEAGSTITLYDTDGTTVLGTVVVDGSGNWSITSSALSAGVHTLTAKATDAAGNTSVVSSGLSITIDTTAPTAPTVNTLSTASTTPTLTGTATLGEGETLTVTVAGATYRVTPAAGVWSLDLSSATPTSGTLAVTAGRTYSVTAVVTDVAGNAATDATTAELVVTGTVTENTVQINQFITQPVAPDVVVQSVPVTPQVLVVEPPKVMPPPFNVAFVSPNSRNSLENLQFTSISPRFTSSENGNRQGFQVAVQPISGNREDTLVVNAPIEDRVFSPSDGVFIQVSADTFTHTNPDAVVVLAAFMADNRPLPAWLHFNGQTGQFEGTPPPGFSGELSIKIIARDGQNHEAVQSFKIKIEKNQTSSQRLNLREQHMIAGRSSLSEQLRDTRQMHAQRMQMLARSVRDRQV